MLKAPLRSTRTLAILECGVVVASHHCLLPTPHSDKPLRCHAAAPDRLPASGVRRSRSFELIARARRPAARVRSGHRVALHKTRLAGAGAAGEPWRVTRIAVPADAAKFRPLDRLNPIADNRGWSAHWHVSDVRSHVLRDANGVGEPEDGYRSRYEFRPGRGVPRPTT